MLSPRQEESQVCTVFPALISLGKNAAAGKELWFTPSLYIDGVLGRVQVELRKVLTPQSRCRGKVFYFDSSKSMHSKLPFTACRI